MPIPDILRYTRLTPWLAKARPGLRHRLGISVGTLAGWLGVTPGHLNHMLQRARTLAESL